MRRPFSCLLALSLGFAASLSAAVQISATGISVPFFDAAGKLTHKLVGKTGEKSGAQWNLREVEIHYFSATDPNVVVQKLQAEEATWDDQKEMLVGRGKILVATEENRLTGEGFDFALATSLLHIHRRFTMENREILLTSDRATIELLVERAGENLKVRDVQRCEAIGNLEITVQPTATREYDFEKAYSELALYDGATHVVTFPRPTRTKLRKGGEGLIRQINIGTKDSKK